MVAIKGMAHFSIAVSDLEKSIKFYCDIVGCKHVNTTPDKKLAFIDAGGDCLILVRHKGPVNASLDDHNGVHHSFMVASQDYKPALDNLRAHGVEVFFEEDRQGGVVNGPRAYFRDPDGTVLEYIDRTSYAGDKLHQ
ncbi:MAG TPA: VOC family protein [Stellaceae bacterium]|nr:VOC family protein [Stellaceae bacterium]